MVCRSAIPARAVFISAPASSIRNAEGPIGCRDSDPAEDLSMRMPQAERLTAVATKKTTVHFFCPEMICTPHPTVFIDCKVEATEPLAPCSIPHLKAGIRQKTVSDSSTAAVEALNSAKSFNSASGATGLCGQEPEACQSGSASGPRASGGPSKIGR